MERSLLLWRCNSTSLLRFARESPCSSEDKGNYYLILSPCSSDGEVDDEDNYYLRWSWWFYREDCHDFGEIIWGEKLKLYLQNRIFLKEYQQGNLFYIRTGFVPIIIMVMITIIHVIIMTMTIIITIRLYLWAGCVRDGEVEALSVLKANESVNMTLMTMTIIMISWSAAYSSLSGLVEEKLMNITTIIAFILVVKIILAGNHPHNQDHHQAMGHLRGQRVERWWSYS